MCDCNKEKESNIRQFFIVKDEFRMNKNEVICYPKRATKGSAGYDFFIQRDITIPPKDSVMIWTDIKVRMEEDMVFEIVPRSSYGIKRNLILKNTIGKIDSDYFENPTNDGNIGIVLYNYGTESQELKAGDAICQGTFFKYYITCDDNTEVARIGGIGSTN